MLGISLRWNIHRHTNPIECLEEVETLSLPSIEICGLQEDQLEAFITYLENSSLKASSIHNPCPDGTSNGTSNLFPGDWLASTDTDRYDAALQYAKKTIDFARRCQVKNIVFHLGYLEMPSLHKELCYIVDNGGRGTKEYYNILTSYQLQREKQREKQWEHIRNTLDKLLEYNKGDCLLCIENRYRFEQLPNLDDIPKLLEIYKSDPVAYWHDFGHAYTQLYLGTATEEQIYSLVPDARGYHVHDSIKHDDHKCPGKGEIDFAVLQKLCNLDMPLILEIDPSITTGEIRQCVSYLQKLGYS